MGRSRYGLRIALAVSLACGLAWHGTGCRPPDQQDTPDLESQLLAAQEAPLLRYGIEWAAYAVDTVNIRPNEALSTLLSGRGISSQHIAQLQEAVSAVFPVRHIRAGRPSYFFIPQDSGAAHYWVYRHTPRVYLKLDFREDTLRASMDTLETTKRLVRTQTRIESSLWNAMRDGGAPVELALELSDIFAWSVDFFGLDKGDEFHAVYEREELDSTMIGLGNVLSAWYVHGSDTVRAYRYRQGDSWSYWDETGNSLRKAFLKAPLRFSRISSHFSHARRHPILKIVRPHTGIDYAAPAGTPVMALGDGTVIEKGYQRGGGNYVKIRHNSVYTSAYLHLQGFAKGITQGMRVQQGDVIGYVGSTGLATGPHLDFRMWKSGQPVNPLLVESPSVEPIDSAERGQFARAIAHQDSLLRHMP